MPHVEVQSEHNVYASSASAADRVENEHMPISALGD
jgi:hypothetical protein